MAKALQMSRPYSVGCLLAALLVCFSTSAHAGPKVIKAKVAEPVAEELMGGCSLKCSIEWQVEILSATGGKRLVSRLLNDESAQKGWIAPSQDFGVGTKFRILFPAKFPPGMDGEVPLYGLDLINGLWKDEENWKSHGRLKRARLSHNSTVLGEITYADSRRWEKTVFEDIMLKSGDTLTLEVLETYPGTQSALAISEIVLQGAH